MMSRFTPPRHVRIYRDLCWYIRFFLTRLLPELIAALAFAALMILLPILAAFVV